MSEFLFEIGLEEIPARMIAGAQAELERRLVALLERERLIVPGVMHKSFSTPRRLAVWIGDVADRQEDASEEVLGPSAKIAFKDGVATPAAVAFSKKAGVAVEALKTVSTPKGEYLQAISVKAGRAAAEVIAGELPKELAGIYWAKNMYWRAGKPERFVRPVRWLLALLGEAVVPVEFAGYTASNVTYGHRVLFGAQKIVLASPSVYEDSLKSAFVLADVEARRHTIRKALDYACRIVPDARWREDHALVDKLTHLTEWPSVIAGSFEPEYLALPEEVLVTVMRDRQNYFAVEDKQGKLAAHFLAVLNTQSDEAGLGVIRHGNARVLRARFNDARFFWEFDQRTPLVQRVALLENVTFQKDLGSYAAKSTRVQELCQKLAYLVQGREFAVDFNALSDAAALAKTDLTCELVKEFTELQGEVGGLYARAQGLSEKAADAIYDQYRPESMETAIARTAEGQLLAIADKADTITGMFGLGLEPTGSKDPFALRRAANGIVKTLAEAQPALPLVLGEVIACATIDPAVTTKLLSFFKDRVEFYLHDVSGNAYDTVAAVMNTHLANTNTPHGVTGYDDIRDAVKRAEAVTSMRGSPDFIAVCAAYKRLKNIYLQALQRQDAITHFIPMFASAIEVDLWNEVELAGAGYLADCTFKRYGDALRKLANLRPVIDRYFESVMVMVDDLEVRANRLGMVKYLVITFAQIADFSEIVTQG
ncbi:MAG: glycine--tRNA ligase subunit beta [Granulicella sp.]